MKLWAIAYKHRRTNELIPLEFTVRRTRQEAWAAWRGPCPSPVVLKRDEKDKKNGTIKAVRLVAEIAHDRPARANRTNCEEVK